MKEVSTSWNIKSKMFIIHLDCILALMFTISYIFISPIFNLKHLSIVSLTHIRHGWVWGNSSKILKIISIFKVFPDNYIVLVHPLDNQALPSRNINYLHKFEWSIFRLIICQEVARLLMNLPSIFINFEFRSSKRIELNSFLIFFNKHNFLHIAHSYERYAFKEVDSWHWPILNRLVHWDWATSFFNLGEVNILHFNEPWRCQIIVSWSLERIWSCQFKETSAYPLPFQALKKLLNLERCWSWGRVKESWNLLRMNKLT